jgi:dihydropteroate synthase
LAIADESGMGEHNSSQENPLTSRFTALEHAASGACGFLATRHGKIDFSRRTVVMGILNITPDSFYDGGHRKDPCQAIADGVAMVEAGAEILDIGGESTRPGARPVAAAEELARVLPVLRGLRSEVKVPISVDTYKSEVAQATLDAGADIVNDISALRFDADMVTVVARERVPLVLMHMQGTPRTMQAEPRYGDVVGEVRAFLAAQAAMAVERGVAADAVILDPGIGFGKNLDHNLELLRNLPLLAALGHPLLVGASRKAFIGKILNAEPADRLEGSLAAAVAAVLGGANILRVHDVRQTVRAARVGDALRYGPHPT